MRMLFLAVFWLSFVGAISCNWCSYLEYSHDNNCKWPPMFPACEGKKQSPIKLNSKVLKKCRPSTLKYINFDSEIHQTLANNGNAIVSYFTSKSGKIPAVEKSGDRYSLDHIRVMIGTLVTPGSDHVIDNTRFSLEYAALFRNDKYLKSDAQNHIDGHLRISRVCESVDADHPKRFTDWDIQFGLISSIIAYNSSVKVPVPMTLRQHLGLLPLKHGKKMPAYGYWGSETIPPCFPAYNIVFHEPIYAYNPTAIDLISIQNKCGRPIANNFRSLQKLNGRRVIGIC